MDPLHHAAVAVVEVEGHRRRLLGEAGPWRMTWSPKEFRLWETNMLLWKITIFHGKITIFHGKITIFNGK